ncbi:hypothetical protein LINGRAHAP2_LOCUS31385 [Linum grandiflorum]
MDELQGEAASKIFWATVSWPSRQTLVVALLCEPSCVQLSMGYYSLGSGVLAVLRSK